MGLYDSVHVNCPSCGTRMEGQSKGGACMMHEYEADNAPLSVAQNLRFYDPCKCGKRWTVKRDWPEFVAIRLVEQRTINEDGS